MNPRIKPHVFRFVEYFISLLDKYRVEFYAFKYKEQLEFGGQVAMAAGTSISMVGGNKKPFLKIGEKNTFRRFCNLTLDNDGCLLIGSNNFFNNNCSINCLGNITIGNNNLFGEDVKIYDHNHKYSDPSILIMEQGFSAGKIEIGNNCWIGSNTIILNNVSIGDNVIIGANNLIYKSIPSGTIVKSEIKHLIKNL